MVVLAATSGCDEAKDEATPPPPPPTAEERFAKIVKTLEERLENPTFGSANVASEYDAPPGTPVAQASVKVDHELTPPTEPNGVYRGVVCLSTPGSKVTVLLPSASEEEKAEAEAKQAASNARLQSEVEDAPELESLLVPSPGGVSGMMENSPIHEIEPGESKRCFEMEFRDGRWVLITDTDPKNEPFYALAIEYALKKQ